MNISFNKEWEIENWYETCTKEVVYGLSGGSRFFGLGDIPEKTRGAVQGAQGNKKEAYRKIQEILEELLQSVKTQKLMSEAIQKAETRWQEGGGQCLVMLSRMLDIPQTSFEKEYRACFTFSKRCPFHKNAFMFNRFSDFLATAMHEIMHIEFLKAYKGYCKKLGLNDGQINHLKEILTVLLNEEMGNYFERPDRGYTKHQEAREEIRRLYHEKTHTHFSEFLKQIAPLVKKDFPQ